MLETTLKENEDSKHLLLEEHEAIRIIMTRGIYNVIAAISLATITLN